MIDHSPEQNKNTAGKALKTSKDATFDKEEAPNPDDIEGFFMERIIYP